VFSTSTLLGNVISTRPLDMAGRGRGGSAGGGSRVGRQGRRTSSEKDELGQGSPSSQTSNTQRKRDERRTDIDMPSDLSALAHAASQYQHMTPEQFEGYKRARAMAQLEEDHREDLARKKEAHEKEQARLDKKHCQEKSQRFQNSTAAPALSISKPY